MSKFLHHIKLFFLPHDKNGHVPYFLKHKVLLSVLYFVLLSEILFLTQIFLILPKTNFLANVLPGALTLITNEQRAEYNLSPLKENELLKKAADLKAKDMAEKGYFSHNTPDGKTPWYWLDKVGYKYSFAGENLAVNFFDSRKVAEAWMNSPSHKANIIKEKYTEIGIGVAPGIYKGKDSVFVVQFFGKPALKPSSLEKEEKIKEQIKQVVTSTEIVKKEIENVLSEEIEPEKIISTIKEQGETLVNLSEDENVKSIINEKTKNPSFLARILIAPLLPIEYTFSSIAILLGLGMLFILILGVEIRHPKMLMRGVFLFFIIVLLLFVNVYIAKDQIQIAESGLEESFIENNSKEKEISFLKYYKI